MFMVQLGKRYPEQGKLTKLLGGEGASLNYDADEKSLTLFVVLNKPHNSEVKAFQQGEISFRLYRNHALDTAIIMVKFGDNLIFDLVYDINVLDSHIDGLVKGNAFHMFLLDSTSGVVCGLRPIGLSPNLMNELNRICKNDGRYTTSQYNEWLNKDVYAKELEELWGKSEKIAWNK